MFNPYEIFKNPEKNFIEIFKDFCVSSFLTTGEVITVVQEIRDQCNKL
jgi:hypothetical protein